MKKSNLSKPDDFPWDLRVITGYQCPACLITYTSPGWCPNKLLGPENGLQGHPQVMLRPVFPDNEEA